MIDVNLILLDEHKTGAGGIVGDLVEQTMDMMVAKVELGRYRQNIIFNVSIFVPLTAVGVFNGIDGDFVEFVDGCFVGMRVGGFVERFGQEVKQQYKKRYR